MGQHTNFVNLFGHAAYCAQQVHSAIRVQISAIDADRACTRDRAILKLLNSWGRTLERSLAQVPEAEEIVNLGGPAEKPTGSVRDAPDHYSRLSEEKQFALCAMVADPLIKWSVLKKLTSSVLHLSQTLTPDSEYQVGTGAFEELIGLHCLIGGEALETALITYGVIAESLIRAVLPAPPSGADAEQ